MGRWLRWFGATATVTETEVAQEGEGPAPKRTIKVPATRAREAARSGTGLPRATAPSPTGVISIEQLAAEMLTAVLVQEKLLTQADEHVALTEHRATGQPVEAILVETGVVAESDLLAVLSRRCKAPLLSLERYRFRPEVLDAVPSAFARANRVIPLERLGKVLNVATSNPLDMAALKRLEEETGFRVNPFLASPREIAASLDKYYPPPPEEALPEAEQVPLSTSQILKESWLGLMSDKALDDEEPPQAPGDVFSESSEEPAAPVVEKAVFLSEEDATAFARVTSGVLYRTWAESVGMGAEDPVAAVPVSDVEFAMTATSEALPKRPPPKKKKKKKKAPAREKSLKTRSGRKKQSRKKKSGR